VTTQLNAQSLIDQVRQRTSDPGGLIWTDRSILDAADLAFESIWDTVRMGDRTAETDRLDVATTSWTRVEDFWYEYELPEYVMSILRVECLNGAGDVSPIEMMPVDVNTKDYARLPFRAAKPGWFRSRRGRAGTIAFMGDLTSFTGARIWYVRRYPPLHFGTAESGSTTTMVFDATPTGRVVRRADIYVGLDVEFTSGTNNTDQIRRITAYDGTTATLASALPTAVSSSQTYALVVPLQIEHGEYFIETTTRRLLARLANTEQLAATEGQFRALEERFRASLTSRDPGNPKRIQRRRLSW